MHTYTTRHTGWTGTTFPEDRSGTWERTSSRTESASADLPRSDHTSVLSYSQKGDGRTSFVFGRELNVSTSSYHGEERGGTIVDYEGEEEEAPPGLTHTMGKTHDSHGSTRTESGDTSYGASGYVSGASSHVWGSTNGTDITNDGGGEDDYNSFPTNSEHPSSTARTANATIPTTASSTATRGYPTITTLTSVETYRLTTTSAEWVTGEEPSTGTSSGWGTALTEATVTRTWTWIDYDAGLTAAEDNAATVTESHTGGTRNKSEEQTLHTFMPLADTVVLFSDGGHDAALLGHALWTFSLTSLPWDGSTTGRFSDLFAFAGSTARSMVISNYQKFSTAARTEGMATVESFITTSSNAVANTTAEYFAEKTNGVWYSDESIPRTEGYTHTYDLGDVESYTAITGTGTNTGVVTRSRHTVFLSGFASAGNAPFTTSTTTAQWLVPTSESHTRHSWDYSFTDTVTRLSRTTTTDEVLRMFQTLTAASGTDSFRSFLGLSMHTTTTTRAITGTFTRTFWETGVEVEVWTATRSGETTEEASGGTNRASGGTTVSESGTYVKHTRKELNIKVVDQGEAGGTANEVWGRCPPHGHFGFVGSFTQLDPTVYLTTTQGLAAGQTFDSNAELHPGPSRAFQGNAAVSLYPIDSSIMPYIVGVGLVRSSLMSEPSGVETCLSVAATWTSTTLAGGVTVPTAREATHTLAVISPITGEFWSVGDMTMDSWNRDIGINGLAHASLGGHGAGEDRFGHTRRVCLDYGAASWTRYTAGATDGTGPSSSTSRSDGTVSFTIPEGAAVRVACERILTARWTTDDPGDHLRLTIPHQHFTHA